MSEHAEPHSVTAKEVNARAASWLERREFENWCATDEVELEAWLAEFWENRVAYWRLKDAWEHTERLSVLRPSSPERSRSAIRNFLGPVILRVAAALIVVGALGGGVAAYLDTPGEKVYATPIGGHQKHRFGRRLEDRTEHQHGFARACGVA